jgi:uncharacterized membrane protein YkvA (DUF1232 family)
MLERVKRWTRLAKRDAHALYLASRDPRVPWHAKALAALVAGYAVSPIDLIPDFIPVLGLVDDAILVPLGFYLVLRLIPPEILAEHRARAEAAPLAPDGRRAVYVILGLWAVGLGLSLWLAYRLVA